ncbi:MAG: hypothetical protein GY906_22390 [bacterium]|nr:hypothetical protein [bacterium]
MSLSNLVLIAAMVVVPVCFMLGLIAWQLMLGRKTMDEIREQTTFRLEVPGGIIGAVVHHQPKEIH